MGQLTLTRHGSSVPLICVLLLLSAVSGGCSACGRTEVSNTANPATPPPPPSPQPSTTELIVVEDMGADNRATSDGGDISKGAVTPAPPALGASPSAPPEPDIRRVGKAPADQVAALAELEEMTTAAARARGTLEAVHMDVVIRTMNTQIKQTDVSTARLKFRGPFNLEEMKIYVHATAPAELYAAVSGEDVVSYRPKINEVHRAKLNSALKSQAKLKEVLQYAREAGIVGGDADSDDAEEAEDEPESKVLGTFLVGKKRTTLVEQVRKKGGRASTVRLWVDQQTGFPVRVEKRESGTRQIFDIRKVVFNPKSTPDEFNVPIPADAKKAEP